MQIQLFQSADELAPHLLQWNCLTRGVPFRTWQWLLSWWNHFQDDGELFVLGVFDRNDLLIGAAPWYVASSASRGRVVRWLGSGRVCSDYLSILATEEHQRAVVDALVEWLLINDAWDLLELTGVAEHDPVMRRFAEQLAAGNCKGHERPGMNCWRIELPETWDEYLATLSKSHRKQVRRVERRSLDSGEARLFTATDESELRHGMAILVDLHNRRRRTLDQEGCFVCPRFAGFLSDAAKLLLADDRLQLHWVELNGRPVAAEFHLVSGNTAYAYQAGVDPDALEHEPGRLINIATLKKAIEDGRRGFDFLRGDEPYKAHWRAEPRPTVEVRIAADRVASQLRHGMWLAGYAMKNWVKSGLGLAGVH